MEITLLTEDELRVSLTRDDMEHYEIDCDHMDYDTTGTRRAFWSILDEARQKTGFDAARDKVCIRVFPSRGGGCELYVTRVNAETEEEHSSKVPEKRTREGLYLLDIRDVPGLLSVCVLLKNAGFSGENAVYILPSGEFCLVTQKEPPAFLSEFTKKTLPCVYLPVLYEHARRIADGDAVSKLAAIGEKDPYDKRRTVKRKKERVSDV